MRGQALKEDRFVIGKVRKWEGPAHPGDFGAGACSVGYLKRFPVDDPLNDTTVRDEVQSAKEKSHTIASLSAAAIAGASQLPRLDVFPRQRRQNPRTMRCIAARGSFQVEKPGPERIIFGFVTY